jgi:putative addiction module component (TIGR02574 family)
MGTERERASDQDIEAAWSEEIERRLAEIDSASVELIPWEEVRAELFWTAYSSSPKINGIK